MVPQEAPQSNVLLIERTWTELRVLCLLLSLAALVSIAGCNLETVSYGSRPGDNTIIGSGQMATRDYSIADFSGIDVGDAFQVEIQPSESFGVTVSGDDNIIDYVKVDKQGQTLRVSLAPGRSYNYEELRLAIKMPRLTSLTLSGAARAMVNELKSPDGLHLNLSGATMLIGWIEAGDTEIVASDASVVELQGVGQSLRLEGSGASQANLADYLASDANVNMSGASKASVNVVGKLSATLSGASRLDYSGNPTLGTISVSSGSLLNRSQPQGDR